MEDRVFVMSYQVLFLQTSVVICTRSSILFVFIGGNICLCLVLYYIMLNYIILMLYFIILYLYYIILFYIILYYYYVYIDGDGGEKTG